MSETVWLWIGFNAFVIAAITIDLFFLHRDAKVISIKSALLTSAVWIGLALIFNYGIYLYSGKEAALNFLAGYLIEESLSIDNLFVFIMLFEYFKTPPQYQHKILFWGILGAIVMRAFFIFFGIALIETFHAVLYIFGLFLIYAGIKMALPKVEKVNLEDNFTLKLLKKWIPVTSEYHEDRFFVLQAAKWVATPMFLVLVMVELTDVVFALDSIPAVIAITRDPFIIYTSNIFAILGLRSLYFALAGLMPLFHFLHYGLAAILIFVGLKMILEAFIAIPIAVSLGFIFVAIGGSILCSLLFPKQTV